MVGAGVAATPATSCLPPPPPLPSRARLVLSLSRTVVTSPPAASAPSSPDLPSSLPSHPCTPAATLAPSAFSLTHSLSSSLSFLLSLLPSRGSHHRLRYRLAQLSLVRARRSLQHPNAAHYRLLHLRNHLHLPSLCYRSLLLLWPVRSFVSFFDAPRYKLQKGIPHRSDARRIGNGRDVYNRRPPSPLIGAAYCLPYRRTHLQKIDSLLDERGSNLSFFAPRIRAHGIKGPSIPRTTGRDVFMTSRGRARARASARY